MSFDLNRGIKEDRNNGLGGTCIVYDLSCKEEIVIINGEVLSCF